MFNIEAVDFMNCTLYCTKCQDYVYDIDFEDIVRTERIRVKQLLAGSEGIMSLRWRPNAEEAVILREKALPQAHSGLRGLRNLGSTCFMNVILQCFIHNPPIRAFFLSDKHNEKYCTNEKTKCMACQMDKLFNQFYCGDTTPVAPNGILWTMWISCKELVGYAQQDSHEFFIGVLNSIHSSLESAGQIEPNRSKDPHACSCIIHSVFSGTFQNCVSCLNCGNKTFAYDPFLDVSLDVRPVFSPVIQAAVSAEIDSYVEKEASFNMDTIDTIDTPTRPVKSKDPKKPAAPPLVTNGLPKESHSLYECLDQFTHEERLSSQEYRCSQCQNQPVPGRNHEPGAVKQLTFKKLPPVLALQLKRYDHRHLIPPSMQANMDSNQFESTGGKIQMLVRFPLELDLTPYTSDGVSTRGTRWLAPDPRYQYSLYAVIVHSGTLNSGHYLCYVRQSGLGGQWFRFDDDMVTVADWKEVSQSQAYMCFYMKK